MEKNSEPFWGRNFTHNFWIIALGIVLGLGIFRAVMILPYTKNVPRISELSNALSYFTFETSSHKDVVPGCWYDSGDYVVFLSRDALAAWYLSIAYSESADEVMQKEIFGVLEPQLRCLENMFAIGVKQFRDQDSHGVHLAPKLHELFYPQSIYRLQPGEGRDAALLLAMTYRNIGDELKYDEYVTAARGLSGLTHAENCCEEGDIVFRSDWMRALEEMNQLYEPIFGVHLWGAQPPAFAALQRNEYSSVAGVLAYVQETFTSEGVPFQYIGGNYDIAGTIVLERLYAKQTQDETYATLSQDLMAYLMGANAFDVDFTEFPNPYHPCTFFRACTLTDVLVNGVDERGDVLVDEQQWRVREIQTYGQAIYVLAKVVMMDIPRAQ